METDGYGATATAAMATAIADYGYGNGIYVLVYIPGVGWVLMPLSVVMSNMGGFGGMGVRRVRRTWWHGHVLMVADLGKNHGRDATALIGWPVIG